MHQNNLVILGGETRYPSDTGIYDDIILLNLCNSETKILPDKLYPGACAFGCIKIILKQNFLTEASA